MIEKKIYSIDVSAEMIVASSTLILNNIEKALGIYGTRIAILNMAIFGVFLVDACQSIIRMRRPYITSAISYLYGKAQSYLERHRNRKMTSDAISNACI